jgi:hypothetical protein
MGRILIRVGFVVKRNLSRFAPHILFPLFALGRSRRRIASEGLCR